MVNPSNIPVRLREEFLNIHILQSKLLVYYFFTTTCEYDFIKWKQIEDFRCTAENRKQADLQILFQSAQWLKTLMKENAYIVPYGVPINEIDFHSMRNYTTTI